MLTMKPYQSILTVFSFLIFITGTAQPGGDLETIPSTLAFTCNSMNSSFEIQGTSSLHDWVMTSQSCKGSLNLSSDDRLPNITDIRIDVEVLSLKSGKNIMDKKCYDALRSKDNPSIVYKLKSIEPIDDPGQNVYNANLIGTLDIAGVIKPASINVEVIREAGQLTVKGSKSLKMSDFDVEPPKALLGTLKTGDEILIVFNLNFIEL